MKKFIALFTTLLVSAIISCTAYANDTSIEIDGKVLNSDVQPQMVNNRLMVPVRTIFEGVGAKVDWDADSGTVTGTMTSTTVIMHIDSNIVSVNGVETTMDAAPFIMDNRTFAPARYVAESFGLDVEWDSENSVVRISTPEQVTKSISDIVTTEATTETTTQAVTETTTQPYQKYSEVYQGNDLYADTDIPIGDYVFIADNDSIGNVVIYEYGGTLRNDTNDKRFVYSRSIENYTVVRVKKNQYISAKSGALVPFDMAEKLDITKNGTFRVGVDIPAGHYTFRLDPSSYIGYIELNSLDDNARVNDYKLYEDYTEITLKLNNGMLLRKYGVDIYDSSLRMYADYSEKSDITSTNADKYNIADVREAYKSKIIGEFIDDINVFSKASKNSSRFYKPNMDKKVEQWKVAATNDSEKRFASILGDMYTRFYYYTNYTNFKSNRNPNVEGNDNYVNPRKNYSEADLNRICKDEKDQYIKYVKYMTEAQDFYQCELALYNIKCLQYGVPQY